MKKLLGFTLTVAMMAGACTPAHEELPTHPRGPGVGGSLIPDAPTPSPSPPPDEVVVAPLPANPGGGGGGTGDVSGSCGSPLPPRISRVKVGVLFTQANRLVLNSSPLIGPDAAYCEQVGYTDGRLYCPVRPEGHPQRSACEALRVGRAADTGRSGPTWTANGKACTGNNGGVSCLNHPDNQFLVFAYGAGTFRACVAGGVCGNRPVP